MSEYTPLEQWLYDSGVAMPGDVRRIAHKIETSDWLAPHDAEALAAERERAALHAEEGYRMEERCDDIAKRIRSGEPAEVAARPGVAAEEPAPMMLVDEREPECVKAWPGCYTFGHDPACCRFPKSCSAGEVRLVPVKQEGAENADSQ